MPVNHAFQSLVAPSDDTTLVRPTQWNENHVVDVDLATEVRGVLPVANGGLDGATTSDLPEGSNLYYTDERVDDRVASLLREGSNIDLTYNDGGGTLTVATVDTPTFRYINTNAGTDPSGANHHIFQSSGGVNRFGIGLIDSESGSNTGSNMLFFTYADNGAYLANAIGFRRSDGHITTGVWNATTIGLAYGGTGADLSGTGGAGQYLKQSSTGASVTVGTIPASDIASGAALTKTDDTNVTLTLGGTPGSALLAATSLTLGWSGQLSAARGGTGIGTYAVGDLVYANTTTSLARLADVATGNALISGGVGVAPSWGKIGLTTHVSGTLPWANGGTNNNSGFTDGSVIFSDGTKLTEQNANFNYNSSTQTLSVSGTFQNTASVNGEVAVKCLNANTGSSAYSILRIGNNTANQFVAFLNSSNRSTDGGTNAATIRNDAGALRLQASGGNGIYINASSNVGINVVPVNKLDVAGGVAVGASYAGVNTVPTNGMLVEGQTIFGATSAFVNARVEIQGNDRITFGMGGTKTQTDGVAQATFFVNPTFSPTSNTTNCSTFLVYGQFSPPSGVTITTGYGLWFQSGGQGGLGSVTTGYNLYVENPGFGTTKIAAYLANLAVGYTGTAPPSSGAIINGSVSIGASSNTYKLDVTGGDIAAMTAGKTLRIKQGTNACAGTGAVLVAGTVTVNTTAVATGDIVVLVRTATGGTQGHLSYTIVNGTSFTVTSSSALDTSTLSWFIIKAS